MSERFRFAPSPTGLIHLGNARTALLNALIARRVGGSFLLRFDDTDRQRSRPEYATAIAEDLDWLGIAPDLTVRQSDRLDVYAEAAERLKAAGRLYPAYETADELERRRRLQLGRGEPPIYDRAALRLTTDERAALETAGRRPHWRFRLERERVAWHDLVRGPSEVDCASLSDPVLIREDGSYLYTLPSVADDAALSVTSVIRGEDHVTNTAVQIQILRALGAAEPRFGHHNLLVTASGEGLSKRSGALSLRSLRERGLEPMAIATLAVLTGSPEPVRPISNLGELADLVDLSTVSRAPARFDAAELDTLNARLLHEMPFAEAEPRLTALGIEGGETFWLAVRGNLSVFSDALDWWRVVRGPVEPVGLEPDIATAATSLLPPAPWSAETWKAWTARIRDATGLKGRALFLPLRLALTGREHGPELASLLPLIGPERAALRLRGQVA